MQIIKKIITSSNMKMSLGMCFIYEEKWRLRISYKNWFATICIARIANS